ncbi:unnamed protein product, partial [Iphiclides podalirius]
MSLAATLRLHFCTNAAPHVEHLKRLTPPSAHGLKLAPRASQLSADVARGHAHAVVGQQVAPQAALLHETPRRTSGT